MNSIGSNSSEEEMAKLIESDFANKTETTNDITIETPNEITTETIIIKINFFSYLVHIILKISGWTLLANGHWTRSKDQSTFSESKLQNSFPDYSLSGFTLAYSSINRISLFWS